MNIIFAVT